jgi:hypothetical protein
MKKKNIFLVVTFCCMGMLASCGGSETREVIETLPHLVTKSDNYELSDEQRDKLNEAMAAGEIENFSTAADGVPTCVDMGLSVYWATFNVGANNPYEYGEYYAWAETEPKENYNARSYKYGISNFDKKTKYCFHEEEGVVDNKGILDLEDDAAHVNWGEGWRTPSKEEWEELNDTTKCTWEFLVLEAGFVGYKVISKITGNCILLPIAGHKAEKLTFFPMAGCYMTNEIYINTKPHLTSSSIHNENVFEFVCHAKNLPYKDRITTERAVFHDFMRTIGMQVRPVTTTISPQPSACMDIDKAALKRAKKDKELVQLQLKTYGIEYSDTPKGGTESSKDGNKNTDSSAGKKVVNKESRFSKASTDDLCKVEVVDMGLSVKWASCNVGASCVYEPGSHFAWGETTTKKNFDESNYKWFEYVDYVDGVFNKYCMDDNSPYYDGKSALEPEDDAAYVNMGKEWRTPTSEEWNELMDTTKCSWTWTTINEMEGYEVTSNITGNGIFLPAVGYRYNSNFTPSSFTKYMSNTASNNSVLEFSSKKIKKSRLTRTHGYVVRAVMEN